MLKFNNHTKFIFLRKKNISKRKNKTRKTRKRILLWKVVRILAYSYAYYSNIASHFNVVGEDLFDTSTEVFGKFPSLKS